jgi:hypothetical protein
VESGKSSGNGKYTRLFQDYLTRTYGFGQSLLTSSCTDALEMAAILGCIQTGDEIIMPSFTFVRPANAFILPEAKIVFTDSRSDHPGMQENEIERSSHPKQKPSLWCIVPVLRVIRISLWTLLQAMGFWWRKMPHRPLMPATREKGDIVHWEVLVIWLPSLLMKPKTSFPLKVDLLTP